MDGLGSWLAYVCFLGFGLWLMTIWNRSIARDLDAKRLAAQTQFRTWLKDPAAAHFQLMSADAEPVHFVEDRPRRKDAPVTHYCLTWFLRNAEGRYVMLMSTNSDKPFVKLLEDRYARAVLKRRYRKTD
ncbi:MAG TPA: hypothetical protein VGE47_10025 [Burkholderiaceae bacterium]